MSLVCFTEGQRSEHRSAHASATSQSGERPAYRRAAGGLVCAAQLSLFLLLRLPSLHAQAAAPTPVPALAAHQPAQPQRAAPSQKSVNTVLLA